MYFLKPISDEVRLFQEEFNHLHKTMKIMLVSVFSCIAAILQAAGGLLPGIGLFISPFATAPLLLCSMFSIPLGVMTYFLTMMLLFIIEPTELIIFPFTTGLLGLCIGIAFSFLKKRISIITAGAILLIFGIISLLYIIRFPVLGPAISDSFSYIITGSITLFAFLYSWLWVEIALSIFKRLKVIIIRH